MTPEVLSREVLETYYALSRHMPVEKVRAIQRVVADIGEDILDYTVEELVLRVHEEYRRE